MNLDLGKNQFSCVEALTKPAETYVMILIKPKLFGSSRQPSFQTLLREQYFKGAFCLRHKNFNSSFTLAHSLNSTLESPSDKCAFGNTIYGILELRQKSSFLKKIKHFMLFIVSIRVWLR